MIKFISTVLLVINCLSIGSAQGLRGGFGHAYFGTAFNLSPGIEKDLKGSSLLGKDLQLNRLAKFSGGGGYYLLNDRILLGGSGYAYKVDDATSMGQVTLSNGGGFINFGYLVVFSKNLVSFPYVGVGGNGMKMKIKNNTSDEPFNIGSKILSPGKEMTFNAGGVSFEVGYAIKLLAFSMNEYGRHSGLMIGLQMGTYLFAGLEDWRQQSSNDLLPDFSSPYSFSPYLRLTLGGGSFRKVGE